MKQERFKELKNYVDSIISSDPYNYDEILKKSKELDDLILKELEKIVHINKLIRKEKCNEIQQIIEKVQVFEKMHDFMMVIDPANKEVVAFKGDKLNLKEYKLYDIFQSQVYCESCASNMAYKKDDTIVKMEYKDNKIYMITAIPIAAKGKRLVITLLKDVTNSLYFKNEETGLDSKMISTIKRINKVIIKDKLTNLYNRRFIEERLPNDLLNSSSKGEPISIIFIDIDFFKSINDLYGHIVGDKVLKEFAKELKTHIRRGYDWVARYGGEEFVICLSNTDINAARLIAERIRKSVMNKEILIDDKKISLTCSFGVHTVYEGDKSLSVKDIIEIADKKLYKAKSQGRNKVV